MSQLSCFSGRQFVVVVHSISKGPRKIEPQVPMAVTYSIAISFLPYPILLLHSFTVLSTTFFPSNKERQRWGKKTNLYPNPCLRVCFGGNKTETSLHYEEGRFCLIYLHIWLPTRLNSWEKRTQYSLHLPHPDILKLKRLYQVFKYLSSK